MQVTVRSAVNDVNRVVSGMSDVQTAVMGVVRRMIESAFSDMRRKVDISEMFEDHLFADLLTQLFANDQVSKVKIRLPECAVRLAATSHFLAIGVQRIIDNPLRGIELVVVLEAEVTKAFSHRVQTGRLGLVPQRVVGVGAVDDLGEKNHRGVSVKLVFLYNRIERAFLAMVPELDVLHVVWNRVLPLGDGHHLGGGDKEKRGVRIDELFDQPRASDPVYLHSLARNPFHVRSSNWPRHTCSSGP